MHSSQRTAIWVLALSLALAVGWPAQTQANPLRGGIPWSFLLCKFSDSPTPPNTVAYYRSMTIATGTNGLEDYVRAISYGKSDLSGSTVNGWYTEPHTLAYETGLSSRWQRVLDCESAAGTSGFAVPSGNRVYVITSPGVDLAGWENTAAIGGDTVALPEIAHEFGHGINLTHSFSNDTSYRNASWAQLAEYDNPWDLMSAANVYVDPTGAFGGGPPDLDAHHLDELGWIPQSRAMTLGNDGILSRTITLAALTHSEALGYLLARVPFDGTDPYHFYTVEYRVASGWDSGIPAGILMINEVKFNSNGSVYQTYLARQLGSSAGAGQGPPLQTLSANGVTITLQGTAGNSATVSISTTLAQACTSGYVWRQAGSIDRVCVTPAARQQAANDNAAAGSRHVSGSDTCKSPYVWREAYPGDHVCVTLATRASAQADDAAGYNHINQGAATYGPNTCQVGNVWRGIDDSDFVCVSYATAAQTKADNAAAGSRHVSGSDTCVSPYVWREAFGGDHVCVTVANRAQAKNDNAQAPNRLAKPNA
jgi:hypothetical protein